MDPADHQNTDPIVPATPNPVAPAPADVPVDPVAAPASIPAPIPPALANPVPAANDPFSPDFQLPLPPPKVSLLHQSKLLLVSLVVYLIDLGCLILAYATPDYQTASTMAQATVALGIIGAALLGAGMVQITLNSANHHGGHASTTAKIGIILSVLSIVAGPLTLIPGLILLLIGLSRPAASNTEPMSPTKKSLLAIAMFIGGGIAGLAISIVIYVLTSTRACNLSSSKCY
jgi:uncharacterized membrane protein